MVGIKQIFTCTGLFVAAVAIALGFLNNYAKQFQVPPPHLETQGLTCEKQPNLCSLPSEERAPDDLKSHGRWKKPALKPNVGDEKHFQFKRWNYISVNEDELFMGAAFVKFYYISDVFLYVVNKTTGEQFTFTGRLPLGIGLSAAFSSAKGCSAWGVTRPSVTAEGRGAWMELCVIDRNLHFRGKVPVHSENTSKGFTALFDIKMRTFEDLILAFPAGGDNNRLIYVHKSAGLPVAKGSYIQLGSSGNKRELQNAAGGLDWTKGKTLYRTFWRWVSLSDAQAEVTRDDKPARVEFVGINLSQDVYDVRKANGDVFSAENAIWVLGRVFPFANPIEISVPKDPRTDLWYIKSTKPTAEESVDLVFKPYGARADNTDFGFIVSDFIQPYGRFSGSITIKDPTSGETITVKFKESTSYGVVENHRAYW